MSKPNDDRGSGRVVVVVEPRHASIDVIRHHDVHVVETLQRSSFLIAVIAANCGQIRERFNVDFGPFDESDVTGSAELRGDRGFGGKFATSHAKGILGIVVTLHGSARWGFKEKLNLKRRTVTA